MKINRIVLQDVQYPYAISVYDCGGRKKVVTAPEMDGPCIGIWADTLEQEIIWEGNGGTMNTCQLEPDGSFLAIQRFYRGFNSRKAGIIHVDRGGGWRQTKVADLPFLHRFCIVRKDHKRYLICSILCADKASLDDWSQPGCVKMAEYTNDGSDLHFQVLLDGIHRNHGMFQGSFRGEDTVLVTGDEGVFQIHETPGWEVEQLMNKPVSDCLVCDVDGDGQEEIITIEPFHGGKVVINQWTGDEWKEVYTYPVDFGHAVWSGSFLGEPAFLIGYRASNAALLLFRLKEKRGDQWLMDVTCIDEHGGPTNVTVVHEDGKEKIFASNGAMNQVVVYEVEND